MIWSWVRRAGVLWTALTVSACAFPKPEPFKGDPFQYSNAFQAAATEAVVVEMTGHGFYEHFEGPGYALSETEVCDPAGLQAFIERRRACWLFRPRSSPDCLNADQCMMWTVDPGVSRNPELWRTITAALETPCAHLTNPDDLPRQYRAFPLVYPRHSFDMLECRSGGLIAEAITLSADGTLLTASFKRRPGGFFARPRYRGRGRT